MKYLICFDMDRVLVDHLSTWQYVYDQLGINNDDAFDLYNQGKLDEWNWLKLDLALLKRSFPEINDEKLRSLCVGTPLMKGLEECIGWLFANGHEVAIISGGMQETATEIANKFPSGKRWERRWGGIDNCEIDTKMYVFTNGWLKLIDGGIDNFGRYQVQMNGKGSIVRILQRRLAIPRERTISIGDSSGDIGMFEQSGLSICFNPLDDKPTKVATITIEEKNLCRVLEAIQNFME